MRQLSLPTPFSASFHEPEYVENYYLLRAQVLNLIENPFVKVSLAKAMDRIQNYNCSDYSEDEYELCCLLKKLLDEENSRLRLDKLNTYLRSAKWLFEEG